MTGVDWRAIKAANPAKYITTGALREQAQRVTPIAFAQFHCSRWGVAEGSWLPPGAWTACAGQWAPEDEPVWLGVDIGGARAASAVVAVTKNLQVAEVHVFQGDEAVMAVVDRVLEIAGRRPVVECAHDPWRFRSEALRLERDHGLELVEWPQSETRMTLCSERLHGLIVEGRLRHPGVAELDQHVAAAIAKPTPRGWRLYKVAEAAQIDAVIALAMASERASSPAPAPAQLLGWI